MVEAENLRDNPLPIDSIQGTHEHVAICTRAAELGQLRTVEIWDGPKLIALNLAIHTPVSGVISDVLCLRAQDPKYKKYGLGIVSILINMEYASTLKRCRWYDLGNTGLANTYNYKRMFFTDVVFRFGICAAGPVMLAEAALADRSGYIYPLLFNHEGKSYPLHDRVQAQEMLQTLSSDTWTSTLNYYKSLRPTAARLNVIERLTAMIEARTLIHEKLPDLAKEST